MGCLANILGLAALIVLWSKQAHAGLWWAALALVVADLLFTSTLRRSLQMYGPKDGATVTWGIICTVTQVSIIGIGVASFFL